MRWSAPRALVALGCLLWSTLSQAAEPARARHVLLLAASDAEEGALAAVKLDLRELVDPIALRALSSERRDRASLSRLTEQHAALAAVWLDQSSSRYVTVYVFEPQSRRLGMRRLPRRSQAEADESVAVVLRATVEALLEGREVPLEAVPLPAESPPPASPPNVVRERHERAALRTGYVGVGFAASSLEHGASFGGSLSITRWLRFGLSYAVVQPAELAAAATTVTLRRRPLDAFFAVSMGLSGFELLGELGSSVDLRERRSEVTAPGLRPSDDTSYAVVSVLGRLRLARELWPQLRFDVGPGLELPVNEPELVVERSSGPVTLASFPVRPRLEAGLSLVIR